MFTFVASVCMCASRGARMCVYVGVCQEKSEGRFNRSASEDAVERKNLKGVENCWRCPEKENNAHIPDLNIEVSMLRGGA